jgi:hypothetical protein
VVSAEGGRISVSQNSRSSQQMQHVILSNAKELETEVNEAGKNASRTRF